MRRIVDRVLPKGPVDLLRQIVLFCGAYWLYRLVRGLVFGREALAFENARWIVDTERALGIYVELPVQRFTARHEWMVDVASWLYVNSHFTITTVTLAWIYLARNERFYFVRNMFMVAMGLALVGYLLVPTAPPRLMPELGFTDTVSTLAGVSSDSKVNALYNAYAAVPSMHVCFALMLGVPMARIVRHRALRVLWLLYPPLVTAVVVVTGNHWVLDAVAGALVAAVSALAAQFAFARARPGAWAFTPHAGAPA
jgi:hypothetical protein